MDARSDSRSQAWRCTFRLSLAKMAYGLWRMDEWRGRCRIPQLDCPEDEKRLPDPGTAPSRALRFTLQREGLNLRSMLYGRNLPRVGNAVNCFATMAATGISTGSTKTKRAFLGFRLATFGRILGPQHTTRLASSK